MAEAFPEMPTGSTPVARSDDISEDAETYCPERDNHSSSESPEDKTMSRNVESFTSKGINSINAILVYHEDEGSEALSVMMDIKTQVPDAELALFGELKTSPIYGSIEEVFKHCHKILLLWTPKFEKDNRCVDISKTLKALMSDSKVSDMIIIPYGFTDGEKPDKKHVAVQDSILVPYEKRDYFLKIMRAHLAGKGSGSRKTDNGQQSNRMDSRQNTFTEQSDSSLPDSEGRKPPNRSTQRGTLAKHTAGRNQSSLLPVDVLPDTSRQSLPSQTADQGNSAVSSSASADSENEPMMGKRSQSEGSPDTGVYTASLGGKSAETATSGETKVYLSKKDSRDGNSVSEFNKMETKKENESQKMSEMGESVNPEHTEGKTGSGKSAVFTPLAGGETGEQNPSDESPEADVTTIADMVENDQQHEHQEMKQIGSHMDRNQNGAEIEQSVQTDKEESISQQVQSVKVPAVLHKPDVTMATVSSVSGYEVNTPEESSEKPVSARKQSFQKDCTKDTKNNCMTEDEREHSESVEMNTTTVKGKAKSSEETQSCQNMPNFHEQFPEYASTDINEIVNQGLNPSPLDIPENDADKVLTTVKRTEVMLEETAKEAAPEEFVHEQTGVEDQTEVKSVTDIETDGQAMDQMGSKTRQQSLSKRSFGDDNDYVFDLERQNPSVCIREQYRNIPYQMNSPVPVKEKGFQEIRPHTVVEDELDELPFIDTDDSNKAPREVHISDTISHMSDIISKYGDSDTTALKAECTTDLVSPECDQVTMLQTVSSKGFEVQMNSLSEGTTWEIHPEGPAFSGGGDDLEPFKPLDRPQAQASDRISDDAKLYKEPVQETQPYECVSLAAESIFSGKNTWVTTDQNSGQQSVHVVTQSTMTSQPASPTSPFLPSTVVINVARNDHLHIGNSDWNAPVSQQTLTVNGSDEVPGKPVGGPDVLSAPSSPPLDLDSTPLRYVGDPAGNGTDLQSDSDVSRSRHHSRRPKMRRLLCCGSQKKYKKRQK